MYKFLQKILFQSTFLTYISFFFMYEDYSFLKQRFLWTDFCKIKMFNNKPILIHINPFTIKCDFKLLQYLPLSKLMYFVNFKVQL